MATTVYPTVTPTAGSPNVKGAYTQVTAATAFASSRLYVWLLSTGAGNSTILVDIATGAAGSETVVVSNLFCYADSEFIVGAWTPIDVDIPAGTRIAVRLQSTANAMTLGIQIAQDSRAIGSLANPVTYGTVTSTSRGTQIDPGGTINTKGAYVQLTASTTARIDALLLCVTFDPTLTNALAAFSSWHVDVATGAAGSEVVVLPDLFIVGNTFTDNVRPNLLRLPIAIPSGTRLAVRCDCSRNVAAERDLRVTLIGMQEPAAGSGSGATSVAYVG